MLWLVPFGQFVILIVLAQPSSEKPGLGQPVMPEM